MLVPAYATRAPRGPQYASNATPAGVEVAERRIEPEHRVERPLADFREPEPQERQGGRGGHDPPGPSRSADGTGPGALPGPDHEDRDEEQPENRGADGGKTRSRPRRGRSRRLEPREQGDERADGVGDQRALVPRDLRFASGERPGLRGEDVQAQEDRGPDAQPSAAVERRRQGDHRQPEGVQHEPLLGPVRDDDPVEGHVEHGPDREQADPGTLRPGAGVPHRPGAGDRSRARSARGGGRGRPA